MKTQQYFNELYQKGRNFVSYKIEGQTEAARQLGMIFPMEPIPVGERVPDLPDVFERVLFMKPENLVYDEEIEELVVKQGYVGGERTTWRYRKAKDSRDVPDPNSWFIQYKIRNWQQGIEGNDFKLLHHREEEDDYPYNRIPPSKSRKKMKNPDQQQITGRQPESGGFRLSSAICA